MSVHVFPNGEQFDLPGVDCVCDPVVEVGGKGAVVIHKVKDSFGIEKPARECSCAECQPEFFGFRVCDQCGNKRCPRAASHTNTCTRSNEPGQEGSLYPAIDPAKARMTIDEMLAVLDA